MLVVVVVVGFVCELFTGSLNPGAVSLRLGLPNSLPSSPPCSDPLATLRVDLSSEAGDESASSSFGWGLPELLNSGLIGAPARRS